VRPIKSAATHVCIVAIAGLALLAHPLPTTHISCVCGIGVLHRLSSLPHRCVCGATAARGGDTMALLIGNGEQRQWSRLLAPWVLGPRTITTTAPLVGRQNLKDALPY